MISSWGALSQERTRAARLVEEEETKRMKEIEADIRELNQHILEQERVEEDRRERLVSGLDRQVQDRQARGLRSYQVGKVQGKVQLIFKTFSDGRVH